MKCPNCNFEHEVKISTDYEVPYTAGYNDEGTVIYIDKRIPETFVNSCNQEVNVYKYLIIHEVAEKALKDELQLDYNTAHSIAMGAEIHACTMDGINYDEYYGFLQKYVNYDIKPDDFDEVPPDLDISPYVADHLTDVVDKIKRLQDKEDE